MLIVIYTKGTKTCLQADVANLAMLKDFLSNAEPGLWNYIKDRELVYGLIDSTEKLKAVTLRKEVASYIFEGYDTVIIGEKIEGNFLFSAIAAGITAAVAASISAASLSIGLGVAGLAGLASGIGFVGAGLLMVGLSFAIGQVIQMLSPTTTMGSADPSQTQKNLMFNGIPNVREQGGSVPLAFGECLIGGVIIAVNVSTIDVNVSDDSTELDKTVKEIAYGGISTVTQGKWYRIT